MFPLFGSNYDAGPRGWLSQANHIFSRLNIAAGLEDYVFLDKVQFRVIVPHPMVDCPDGYLFLCPEHYFQVGASSFKWPDTSAYWSLDPSGIERLSMEEAVRLGFPRFKLLTEVAGHSWETSVYDGLRQFHQGKGFDPESQDVARHFGYPLFRLSTDVNPPLEHGRRESGR
ncbi:hypothetical protein C8R46DRAFT_480201 [Mycena filopes]|nr:hypothetical protein C8R46DRAFT_480201 [Mycena filopes]